MLPCLTEGEQVKVLYSASFHRVLERVCNAGGHIATLPQECEYSTLPYRLTIFMLDGTGFLAGPNDHHGEKDRTIGFT